MNGRPSRPDRTASAISVLVLASSAVAGATSRAAPAREMASTTAASTERQTASACAAGCKATTDVGIRVTRSCSRSRPTSAGTHRTRWRPSPCRLLAPFEPVPRRTGTMRPSATSSVPHRAISPAHRRLGPMRSPANPAPTPTSQPNVWAIGADRASAAGAARNGNRGVAVPRDAGRIGLFQELSQIVGGCIHAGTARPHDDAAFRPRRLE